MNLDLSSSSTTTTLNRMDGGMAIALWRLIQFQWSEGSELHWFTLMNLTWEERIIIILYSKACYPFLNENTLWAFLWHFILFSFSLVLKKWRKDLISCETLFKAFYLFLNENTCEHFCGILFFVTFFLLLQQQG